MTARLIVRHPSEPLYHQIHKRSRSRDAIIDMQTPRVALKQAEKTLGQGDESVKTTRSLKIVTYASIAPEMTGETVVVERQSPKGVKKAHKKSSSGKVLLDSIYSFRQEKGCLIVICLSSLSFYYHRG